MLTINHADGYELSADPDRLDTALVHHWLSTDAYWALGRSREVFDRAIAGSSVFGVYRPQDGAQVAFARVVSDGAAAADAHGVYAKLGFQVVREPDRWMELDTRGATG